MMAPFIGAYVSVYSNIILITTKNKLNSAAGDSEAEISFGLNRTYPSVVIQ